MEHSHYSLDGQIISHYRILEKLGAGGMGEVYLAEDTKLGRKVALKLLSEELTQNRDRLSRFDQEAYAASALNHPNILTIYEMGDEGGRHYIVAEFVDGMTLRKRLRAAPMDLVEVLHTAIQIAGALDEAHAAGIVHRDIKPENVMIRRTGHVKVLDFGLAKLTERPVSEETDKEAVTRALVQTDAGVVMGTSQYMSPEQARGKPIDGRTDIWSLGVVLYEMAAGRAPFFGDTKTDVIVAIAKTDPPPIARFAPNLPAEFEWIVMKALRKHVDERYQTVKEFESDLKKLKQRLEFQTELERSMAPERLTGSLGAFADTEIPPTLRPLSTHTSIPITARPSSSISGASTRASSAEYIVSEIKRHKRGAVVIALAVILIGAMVAYFALGRKRVALTDKDTILLADFTNTTSEPVFNRTLKQALSAQLGQSPSLEALQAYSFGFQEHSNGKYREAIPFYKHAIELDQNFASAFARLAYCYNSTHQNELSREASKKAYELRDRASEREKLYIAASYFGGVTGEWDRQIEALEVWQRTYPRDWTPFNLLANRYTQVGPFEKAIENGHEAVRINPKAAASYVNLAVGFMGLKDRKSVV